MINIINLALEDEIPVFDIDLAYAVNGSVDSPAGPVPRLNTTLTARDYWHDWRARWSIKRNHFRIPTGLYAIGCPDEHSPVLVTANYKLTLDKLRIELGGLNLWILVIDTKGVNVWCSAGKGTFSAPQIIKRINQSGLHQIVSHRRLILPQLAAPGVASQQVVKATGFKVIYGPIRSADIADFLANHNKASAAMRQVRFNLWDRIILTPVELLMAVKFIPIILLFFLLLNVIKPGNASWLQIIQTAGANSLPYLAAIVIGSVFVPVMLPVLPFKSFALKGTLAGLIWSGLVIYFNHTFLFKNLYSVMLGNSLLLTALIAFLSLNFTGATPYTSFSGTQKETLAGVPVMAAGAALGIILLVISRFGWF